MKAASKLSGVKHTLQEKNLTAVMIENCGLSDERIYQTTASMPEQASYYTTVLVKEGVHD